MDFVKVELSSTLLGGCLNPVCAGEFTLNKAVKHVADAHARAFARVTSAASIYVVSKFL